jgi:formate hydrogenlyase subunit 3/multisubunit Na+/H+ antiporter MnhD subunit
MILLPAAVKSAQMPFSHWLPRAMEGPTPSSAIFYGSLASHMGAFLLLRTFSFWEHQASIRLLIGLLGLVTAVIASPTARVQSSVKAQVAYSSIAQIGLIFIEIAAGFELLALIHITGNAFLRTYQLLISPSTVTYLIREQFYNFKRKEKSIEDSFPKRIEYTMYMLSLKEWNLDSFNYKYLWNPMKRIGSKFKFLENNRIYWFLIPVFGIGGYLVFNKGYLPSGVLQYVPSVLVFVGLLMVLKSFTERKNVFLSWALVALNHVWIALAIAFNGSFNWIDSTIYLSGVAGGFVVGYFALRRLQKLEGNINLDNFHGLVYEHPKIAFLFLLSCLALAGFPISPTFIGEDLIFNHIGEHQYLLASLVALCLINDGLAVIRIYARVFLGPHTKSNHEVAHRSA